MFGMVCLYFYFANLFLAITTLVTPFEPYILYVVSLVVSMGLSFGAALCLDILSVLTVHISFLHASFALVYSTGLSVLSSLWKLFRGKKHNILRKRIDSYFLLYICSASIDVSTT